MSKASELISQRTPFVSILHQPSSREKDPTRDEKRSDLDRGDPLVFSPPSSPPPQYLRPPNVVLDTFHSVPPSSDSSVHMGEHDNGSEIGEYSSLPSQAESEGDGSPISHVVIGGHRTLSINNYVNNYHEDGKDGDGGNNFMVRSEEIDLSSRPFRYGNLLPFYQKIIIAVAAVATGLAMMPIFNDDIKVMDDPASPLPFHVHNAQAWFWTSTATTWIVYTTMAASQMIIAFKMPKMPSDTNILSQLGRGVGAVSSSILHISLLWYIELRNLEISRAKNCDGALGCDAFILWAAIGTLGLLIYKTLITYNSLTNFFYNRIPVEQGTLQKLFTYVPLALSLPARYEALRFCSRIMPEPLPFIAAAFGTIATTVNEAQGVRNVLSKRTEPMGVGLAVGAVVSTVAGAWFSLPKGVTGWNASPAWTTKMAATGTVLRAISVGSWVVSATINTSVGIFNAAFGHCRGRASR